jgi:parallel beta helix pectate lyase-like protein
MRRRDLVAGLAIVGTTGSPLHGFKRLLIGAAADLRVGPRVPVGPEETTAPPGAVVLSPQVDVQEIIDDHPAGTTYFFSEGIYARQSLRPKRGDSYIGARGAVLDGQNATTHAFRAESANEVVIRNLVVQHYTAKAQDAPIRGGKDWVVRKCEIAFNAGAGLLLSGNWEVDACKIHHNLQLGFGGVHDQAPAHVHDCEIGFNNFTDAYSPEWEAGGCKFWESNGAIFEYNWSHDNHGGGVWTDSNNDNFHCHHNLVENNWAGGIMHEIGWSASIHDNLVRNNSSHKYCGGTYLWQGEITISASGGLDGRLIEIFNNTIVSNYRGRGSDGLAPANGNAITIVEQRRTDSPSSRGPHLCHDIHVHHNHVDLRKGGLMGAATDWATDAPRMFSTAANIKFEANQYIGAGPSTFWWKGVGRDFAGWQALGFDTAGTST